MCRLVAALFAVALLAAPLAAQDPVMDRLQRRADSLLSTWREAQRLADIADSLERERATAGSDTIAVGALRIIANPLPLALRAAAEAARSCFLGAIPKCADVLELNDSAGILERWYVTAAEREALVRGSFTDYFARGPTAPGLQRCLQHHDDACTGLLQALPRGALPRPLGPEARLALMREALRAGGREAYARLVADPHAPIAT